MILDCFTRNFLIIGFNIESLEIILAAFQVRQNCCTFKAHLLTARFEIFRTRSTRASSSGLARDIR